MCKEQIKEIDIKRHSAAHILAMAVLDLHPDVKFGIGPVIDDGFYYDFETENPITEDELKKIEKKMKKLISQNIDFEKSELDIDEAKAKFENAGQKYKTEIIDDLKVEGEETISIYKSKDFEDLCRGPHVKNSKEINTKALKITRLAGAYWKSDENREQLTRVYGVLFETKEELAKYNQRLAEAKKRDHRKLGKELDLFFFSNTVGSGLPMLTEKGATIRRILERFIVDEELRRGYKHVYTQDIAKIDLYKKSGHYPYYKDSMYAPIEIDKEQFMLRPMTCPHHFELFLRKPHSYRDLPVRYAELAKLYRYEQSGELSGLMRVRSFTLADAHIFCADDEQAGDEISRALDLIEFVSKKFGLKMGKDYWYTLALGDRNDAKKYYKDDKAWDTSEEILRNILKNRDCVFNEEKNEAAFYGPKIDIQMKNVSGKEDTAFTVQYDFVMPKRFDLNYTNESGEKQETIVVHRSSIGALERIMAFLIEHYAGAFPLWLSPIQAVVIPVSDKFNDYGQSVAERLQMEGFRAELDNNSETLGKRIRVAQKAKTPYMLVVGEKEVADNTVAVRSRDNGDEGVISVDTFVKKMKEEIS
ncbi:MAG TPA: threonine--tRNA ligase [Candidatus Pacebacteria bacterium]|nr:threonine--tRNA ligase [Candidatus Paceibacterota bacterium]